MSGHEKRCGYAVTDAEGIEEPCDRPTTGWRWYQDCGHEDMLDVACDWHENEGGRRLAEAEAKVARVEAAIRLAQPDHLTPMGARIIRKALGGGE